MVFSNFLFFLRKDFAHNKKHQKAQKSTKSTKKHKSATKQKHKNANKRTKIKNALKKHLRGKKSLIRLFALLRLRRKRNRKTGLFGPVKKLNNYLPTYLLVLI